MRGRAVRQRLRDHLRRNLNALSAAVNRCRRWKTCFGDSDANVTQPTTMDTMFPGRSIPWLLQSPLDRQSLLYGCYRHAWCDGLFTQYRSIPYVDPPTPSHLNRAIFGPSNSPVKRGLCGPLLWHITAHGPSTWCGTGHFWPAWYFQRRRPGPSLFRKECFLSSSSGGSSYPSLLPKLSKRPSWQAL